MVFVLKTVGSDVLLLSSSSASTRGISLLTSLTGTDRTSFIKSDPLKDGRLVEGKVGKKGRVGKKEG